MFTDPDGAVSGLLAGVVVILGKMFVYDRVRGNGHVTKADLAGLASAADMTKVKADVSDLKADFSEVKGWLRGRMGEPPR